MRRLNFLEDEPWDKVDDKRVRWFGVFRAYGRSCSIVISELGRSWRSR